MTLKVINVKKNLFKGPDYEVLKNGECGFDFIPVEGDILYLDFNKYKVKQRVIRDLKNKDIVLYVKQIRK